MEDEKLLSRLQDVYKGADVSGGNEEACLEVAHEKTIGEILAWTMQTSPDVPKILWLSGMPGAGKSLIARSIAQRLNRSKQSSHFAVDFSFRRSDSEKRTPFALWCYILFKLASRYRVFKDVALSHLRAEGFDLASSEASDILKIITEAANIFLENRNDSTGPLPVIVIAIDALDECPQTSSSHISPRESVLAAIASLPRCFKVLVTSGEETDLDVVLRPVWLSLSFRTGKEVKAVDTRGMIISSEIVPDSGTLSFFFLSAHVHLCTHVQANRGIR